MNFEKIETLIQSQLSVTCTIRYGSIGPEYLHVLAVIDNQIVSVGEFLYRIWKDSLVQDEQQFIEFAKECQKYINGVIDITPTWCYKNGILTFKENLK